MKYHRSTNHQHDQEGFTLIEILVVMFIIGVLSAIAIPVMFNQRKLAVDATVKNDVAKTARAIAASDIKNKGTPEEFPTIPNQKLFDEISVTPGNTLTIRGNTGDFCILGKSESGMESAEGISYLISDGGFSTRMKCDESFVPSNDPTKNTVLMITSGSEVNP